MAELPFDQSLFTILVCPDSRKPVKWVDGQLISTDPETRRAYRVDGDVPVMLIEESEQLSQESWQAAMDATGPVSGAHVPQ